MVILIRLLILLLLLHLGGAGFTQQITRQRADPSETSHSSGPVAEKKLQYNKEVLRQEFDFRLSAVAEGKFSLDIATGSKGPVFIKVYDIIGNLLYQKNVRVRGTLQEEVDLSHLDVHFFVVEVGNEETNRTKSIVTL